jgi:hypothetical protein
MVNDARQMKIYTAEPLIPGPSPAESKIATAKLKRYSSPGTQNIILPVVLSECETWSLKFREEHRLEVFENRVLMRICESKMNEIIEGCRMKGFVTYIPRQILLG